MRRAMTAMMAVGMMAMAGCEQPDRIDATDEATFARSLDAMAAHLPEPRRSEFNEAVKTHYLPAMLREAVAGATDPGRPKTAYKAMHGLTAAEILAKAETMPPLPPGVAEKGDAARAQAIAK